MHDWNIFEDESEVLEEICEGIGRLSRSNVVTLIAALMYEMGINFHEVSQKIEDDDGTKLDITSYL